MVAVAGTCTRRPGRAVRKKCEAAERVRRGKVVQKRVGATTPERAEAILRAVSGHRWEGLYILAMATGLRQGNCSASSGTRTISKARGSRSAKPSSA